MENDIIAFKRVSGGTHDMPALIFGLTDIPLFFLYEENGTIEEVKDDIDKYEGISGSFLVYLKDYEKAYTLIELHDEIGLDIEGL